MLWATLGIFRYSVKLGSPDMLEVHSADVLHRLIDTLRVSMVVVVSYSRDPVRDILGMTSRYSAGGYSRDTLGSGILRILCKEQYMGRGLKQLAHNL